MEGIGYSHELGDKPAAPEAAAPEAAAEETPAEEAPAEEAPKPSAEEATPAEDVKAEDAKEAAEPAKITLFFWKPANRAKPAPRRHGKGAPSKGGKPAGKGRPAKGGNTGKPRVHASKAAPKPKVMDPDSPFAALQSLKQQMKS